MKLIEIWSEDSIQAMLEGSRRNKDILRISKQTKSCGFILVENNVVVKLKTRGNTCLL